MTSSRPLPPLALRDIDDRCRSITGHCPMNLGRMAAFYYDKCLLPTLSRRWRLKKQTFARHLELRSGRPETANRVFGSYVRHHDRDWRTEASFAVRRTPLRAHSIACSSTSRNPCRAESLLFAEC